MPKCLNEKEFEDSWSYHFGSPPVSAACVQFWSGKIAEYCTENNVCIVCAEDLAKYFEWDGMRPKGLGAVLTELIQAKKAQKESSGSTGSWGLVSWMTSSWKAEATVSETENIIIVEALENQIHRVREYLSSLQGHDAVCLESELSHHFSSHSLSCVINTMHQRKIITVFDCQGEKVCIMGHKQTVADFEVSVATLKKAICKLESNITVAHRQIDSLTAKATEHVKKGDKAMALLQLKKRALITQSVEAKEKHLLNLQTLLLQLDNASTREVLEALSMGSAQLKDLNKTNLQLADKIGYDAAEAQDFEEQFQASMASLGESLGDDVNNTDALEKELDLLMAEEVVDALPSVPTHNVKKYEQQQQQSSPSSSSSLLPEFVHPSAEANAAVKDLIATQ